MVINSWYTEINDDLLICLFASIHHITSKKNILNIIIRILNLLCLLFLPTGKILESSISKLNSYSYL